MLRLLALLLVCLVLPVRALTLTPVAGELRHPWGLAFLPDGGYLVSERPGRLLRIDAGGERHVISGLPPLAAAGQGQRPYREHQADKQQGKQSQHGGYPLSGQT